MAFDFRVIALGLAIAIVWSIYLVLVKLSTMFVADQRALIFALGMGAFLVFLVYAIYNRPMLDLNLPISISFVAGMFWAIGIIFLIYSVNNGVEIAKLSPLIGLSILFVTLISIFVLNEAHAEWFEVIISAALITLGIYILI